MTAKPARRKTKRWVWIVLIALMNMTVPLATDIYLPAIPHMTGYFSAPASVVNLTLVGFFLFLAVGILIFGPLSDKYGRRPLLLGGIGVYFLSSCGCALAATVEQLILLRVFQALGAGCMTAVSTAMIKDCFSGKTRDGVLAAVQALMVIAPMVAPLLGALIISIAGWRATFWLLALLAVPCLAAVAALPETLPASQKYRGNLAGSLGRLAVVAKNRGFLDFLLLVSVLTAPYLAYIAVCSYIYIHDFGLSITAYSYFFAGNSAMAVLGPFIYLKSKEKINPRLFTAFCLSVTLISGILLLTAGHLSALAFFLCFIPFTVVESALRPFSTAILLEQQKKDTGSASALINFVHTALGSFGMILGTLPWSNYIGGLGVILSGCALLSVLGWLGMLRRKVSVKGLTEFGPETPAAAV